MGFRVRGLRYMALRYRVAKAQMGLGWRVEEA